MKLVPVAAFALALTACAPAQHTDSGAPATDATAPGPATTAAGATDRETTADTEDHAPATAATTTLARYHWRLADATDASGRRIDALLARADKPLQLDFDAQAISVSNTCNRMHGGYSLSDGKLEIGQLAATLMACNDPALQALDAAVGRYLAGSLRMTLQANADSATLELATADGDKLSFNGVPTADTVHGGPGETIFLEVAPDTVDCKQADDPDASCLKVRELHYAANGVRSGEPGPWHELRQPIEGYRHQPGVRNVLRVKRYPAAAPAEAASTDLVLDMVVESQLPPHE